jgi:haloacetate dehalogenase
MFEGATRTRIAVGDVEINCVFAGQGPPLLLLHGYPQNLSEWAALTPLLTQDLTVVCSDLRGYGDSSKPRAADDGSTYSFRTMAADQVALMEALRFSSFHVGGHDRGGRVAHRMALDHPDRALSLSLLDLVPTYAMYNDTNARLAARYWQWYFLPLPEPFPERLIGADPDYYFENCLVANGGAGLERYDADMLAEYRRCWRDPAMIHASCSDYRSGATVDLAHDAVDLDQKVACPTLALWGADGLLREQFDIGVEWAKRCSDVRSASVPGGHFFPEHNPRDTAERLLEFVMAAQNHRGADRAPLGDATNPLSHQPQGAP